MFGTREDFESFSNAINLSGITSEPVRTEWESHNLTEKRLPKSILPIVAKQLGLKVLAVLQAIDLDKQRFGQNRIN